MKFYVDSLHGSDRNNGAAPETAWRSLEKVHQREYTAGDEILFRRGCVWKGMFCPAGNGAKDAPILIDTYGDDKELPIIDGCGAQAAVLLRNVDYWTVRNLMCKNTAQDRFTRAGIAILGRAKGVTKGLTIQNCEVTQVKGENRRGMPFYRNMYWSGGIYVTIPYKSTAKNHLEDILIEGNYIHDVICSGIRINQEEDSSINIHHKNVIVRCNRIERTGADGIIVANCAAPLIEYNRCYDAGALGNYDDTFLIAGVWVCATSDAIIQYNEVARTRLFSNDGTAFDTDWGTAGHTIFQYNYSHENEGGFWLDCTSFANPPNCKGSILRGNVSVNDKRCLVQADTGIETRFEDNVFIQTGREAIEICTQADGKSHHYFNNFFALAEPPKGGWQESFYQGNTYTDEANNPKDVAAKIGGTTLVEKARRLTNLDGCEEVFGLSF